MEIIKKNSKIYPSIFKGIGHHKTYLVDSLNYIKENEFDNMEFAKILL